VAGGISTRSAPPPPPPQNRATPPPPFSTGQHREHRRSCLRPVTSEEGPCAAYRGGPSLECLDATAARLAEQITTSVGTQSVIIFSWFAEGGLFSPNWRMIR